MQQQGLMKTLANFGIYLSFFMSSSMLARNPDLPAQTFQQFNSLATHRQASQDTLISPRSLEEYHVRRAYPGAPPVIPHPLMEAESKVGEQCLSCHKTGGFVPSMSKFTPVTPHPEFVNCKQCHVRPVVSEEFRKNMWIKIDSPALKQPKIPGGPPPIPHSLWLRENCQACHTGPAAMKEIKSSHPERVHCQQCHVEQFGAAEFERK